jgi:RHS repeat-associated protein
VQAVTNSSTGNTTATYAYTAYGQPIASQWTGADKNNTTPDPTKTTFNAYRYNAMRWDSSSGQYDMGFRNYSANLNAFLSRDMYNGVLADMQLTTDPFTGNRYTFGAGNPISNIELDGHLLVGANGGATTPHNNCPSSMPGCPGFTGGGAGGSGCDSAVHFCGQAGALTRTPAYRQFLNSYKTNNPYATGPQLQLGALEAFCNDPGASHGMCGPGLTHKLFSDYQSLAAAAVGAFGILPGDGEDDEPGTSATEARLNIQAEQDISRINTPGDAGAGGKVIPWIAPGSLPSAEEASLDKTVGYIESGTTPSGSLAKKWGTPFKNWGGDLPGGVGDQSPYLEYRVAPTSGTSGAGPLRVVYDPSSGEMYYTWTHYGDAGDSNFVRIR